MHKHYFHPLLLIAILLLCRCKKEASQEAKNRPPGPFELVAVPDKQTGTEVLPTLTWQKSNDPDNDKVLYAVILETVNGESITAAADLTDTFYTFETRLETSTYYKWKVAARDDKGGTRVSTSTFGFTTRNMHAPQIASRNATSLSRMGHTTVLFKDKIWLIGGRYATGKFDMNDIWSSADGDTWESVNVSAPFQPRKHHSCVVFDNKLWLIGGDGYDAYQDIWYSENGANWTQATVAPFEKRYAHATVIFDNKIWVIGGTNHIGKNLNDIWNSEDGKNWVQVTENAPFSTRFAPAAVVFQNKIWIVGGWDNTTTGSVWYSSNGNDWTLATDNAAFGKRRGHTITVFDNKLWLIGGSVPMNSSSTFHLPKNDIWVSSDGITWTQYSSEAPFKEREFHTAIAHRNKLLVLFGGSGTVSYNDVWSIE